jgi:predicted Zn-dependent protease
MLLDEGEETKLGLDSYQKIVGKAKVSTDPRLNEQVTRVGRRIAEATGRSDYQWEFKVLDDPQANAFCLPGGKVAVYTGILPITRDEAGLAAVVGHEVAHAVARHGGERLSQEMAAQNISAVAAQALTSGSDPAWTQMVGAAFGILGTGALRPFSRAQESEADHLGLIYMAKAGYHPSAARDLWVRMGQATGGGQQQSWLTAYLSTHPSSATRVAQIEGWMPEALTYYKPR